MPYYYKCKMCTSYWRFNSPKKVEDSCIDCGGPLIQTTAPAPRIISSPLQPQPAPALQSTVLTSQQRTQPVESGWSVLKQDTYYNSCTDFAFEGDFDLGACNSTQKATKIALKKGYKIARNPSEADIICYGGPRGINHAIRKVQGTWQQHNIVSGNIEKYNRGPTPPSHSMNAGICLMLVKPQSRN